MNRPQDEQPARAGKRRGDASPAVLTLLPARGAEPLLEAVDEAGHVVEGAHACRPKRIGHLLILNR
jgi:hypothetical protein